MQSSIVVSEFLKRWLSAGLTWASEPLKCSELWKWGIGPLQTAGVCKIASDRQTVWGRRPSASAGRETTLGKSFHCFKRRKKKKSIWIRLPLYIEQRVKLYLSAHQQLEGVVDSGALVQQKGFELHLLHIVERVKNDCQKLEGGTQYLVRKQMTKTTCQSFTIVLKSFYIHYIHYI